MQVRLTQEMLEAFKATPEIPANLVAKAEGATKDGDAYVLQIDEEERMSMEEMCQWYVIKDPDTGELNEKGVLFNSIIDAIYDADLG
jgi:hypothetical protein